MNNFNNPFENPYSVQDSNYQYFQNQKPPLNIKPNLKKLQETIQNGEQTANKSKSKKTKKSSIYTNDQAEDLTGFKPVIFSPPATEANQNNVIDNSTDEVDYNLSDHEEIDQDENISNLTNEFIQLLDDGSPDYDENLNLHENPAESRTSSDMPQSADTHDPDYVNNMKNHEQIDEHKNFINMSPKDRESDEETTDFDSYHRSDEEDDRSSNETIANYEDTFYSMLQESDESLVEDQNDSSANTLKDEDFHSLGNNDEDFTSSLSEFDEAVDNDYKETDSSDEDTDTQEDKLDTALSESDKSDAENQANFLADSQEENYCSLNKKNDDKEAYEVSLSKINDSQDIQYKYLAEDDFESDEKSDADEDKFDTMLENEDVLEKEKSEEHIYLRDANHDDHDSSSEDDKEFKSSLEDDFYNQLNKDFPDNLRHNDNDIDEDTCNVINPSYHKKSLSKKKNYKTVNMTVLLAKIELEVDLSKTIHLSIPTENVSKIEWSVESLECKVVLPSTTGFFKGEFIADLEFNQKDSKHQLQSLRIPIPWSKTATIQWLNKPDFPHSKELEEYMFKPQNDKDSVFHYKSYEEFSEPIQTQLKSLKLVWHQEQKIKDKHLQVECTAKMQMLLMQEQLVELECYLK